MDVYIQPSLQEGLPRALLEAMSRGLPCIGSNAGGIPELLEKKMIFKKRNVKQLCKILKNLNKEELINSANYNFKKSKLYNLSYLNNKRNNFYDKILKN